VPGRADEARTTARPRPRQHPRRRRRLVSAGEILGVGVVCFALWTVLDARQLYNSASSSPPGTRRSVSMSVLRPIARVEEVFGIDRVVNGANRALGRNGPGTAGTVPVALPPTSTVAHTHPTTPASSSPPPPSTPSGSSTPKLTTPVTPTTEARGPAALRQPSAAKPLTLLEVGDSLGVDLGYGLGDVLAGHLDVHLVQDAKIDTGLANVAYYNWPASLEVELKALHPRLVVVFLGGNDVQGFDAGGRLASFGTPFWRQQYSARVAAMMREATAAGAQVLWVGMPIMSPSAAVTNADMEQLNAIYQRQASRYPGVTYDSSWKVFENSSGAYAEYLPNASGSLVEVRDPDGIHLAPPAGEDLLASAVVTAIDRTWHLHI